MKITVEAITCDALQPGDLFSTAGDAYWNGGRDRLAVGERVYIRTEAPCPADQASDPIFRITVEPV